MGNVQQTQHDLPGLLEDYRAARLSRRQLITRAAAMGIGASAAAGLLVANTPQLTAAQDAEPVPGGRFTWGYDRDVNKLDPVASGWADPGYNALYEYTMIRHPETGLPVAALAESWTVSDDGMEWRLKIRDGITFQSGAPCTAEIVAQNFNVFRNPETGQNAIFWATVTDVTADGNEVVVTTSAPFAAFPETLATEYSMPYNPAVREELGDQFGASGADGTGPFTLTNFAPGQEALLTKWAEYHGSNIEFLQNKGPAYIDELRFVPILEAGNRAIEVESGNVDAVTNPGGQDVDRLAANPDLVVVEFPQPSNVILSLNHKNTSLGFDDIRVRQAISHAIDREGIAQAVYFGHATPTQGPIASNWKWYDAGVEAFNTFDPELAKSMLDEAGWVEGSDGIREKDGVKLSWTNVNFANQPFNQPIMEIISENLRSIGAEMSNDNLELAAFQEARAAEPASWSQEWLWSSPIDVLIIFGRILPNAEYNGVTPALEQGFADWQSASTEEELIDAASRIQLEWAEQLTKIPVVTANGVWVNRTSVHGFTPSQSMLYPLFNDVWVEQ
ncbi:MAG: ABC transporter substrate-binding protein [Thermomicrobiales bacterium]